MLSPVLCIYCDDAQLVIDVIGLNSAKNREKSYNKTSETSLNIIADVSNKKYKKIQKSYLKDSLKNVDSK